MTGGRGRTRHFFIGTQSTAAELPALSADPAGV
jgi:hypothetical protein